MRRASQLVLLLLAMLLAGCASTRSYFADRGRDAADVFSLSVGKGMGAKVRAGPVTLPLLVEYTAAGLRGGEICSQDLSGVETNYHNLGTTDGGMGPLAFERFDLAQQDRGKNFAASSRGGDTYTPFITRLESESSAAYYGEVEAVVAVWYSVRVGFNVLELLDFVVGWTTLDMFHDDIGTKNGKSNQALHGTTDSRADASASVP